ncbi:MAG: DUF58 domain-containing protein [Planctomycetota bacterium]
MQSEPEGADSLQELLREVRQIEVQSKRLVTGAMAGGYASVFRGAGIEFDEVREYADGDDPRMVDWNVTARVGRPFVKKFVDERELTVLFALDLSASMTAGFGAWSARQMAARVCACLALSAVRNHDRVGLIACSDTLDAFVPPKKGTVHALRIVRDCLALPGSQLRTDLVPALEAAARLVRRRAVVFVVSDFLCAGWERAMTLCARRHDVIAIRLLAPEVAGAPRGLGVARLRDPETGADTLVDWRSREVCEAYAARTAAWRAETRDALRRARVDVMDVPVPRDRDRDAVVRPLLRFFSSRAARDVQR